MQSIKCAWCGAEVALTAKGRPKQHQNGNKTCVGSGQLAATHESIRQKSAQNVPASLKKGVGA